MSSARTRIEPRFDSDEIRRLKDVAEQDISIGGPELAAQAIRAGLVDEHRMFVTPVIVGGGTRAFPDGVRLSLDLTDEHRFGNGVVYLAYRPTDHPCFFEVIDVQRSVGSRGLHRAKPGFAVPANGQTVEVIAALVDGQAHQGSQCRLGNLVQAFHGITDIVAGMPY